MAAQSNTVSSTMTMVWLFLVSSICIPSFLNQVYADKPRDDLEVLSKFINAKSADHNGCLSKWNVNDPNACSWERIQCDSGSRITGIELGGCNIIGKLIPEFGQLENLMFMNLNTNALSGGIPSELGNLVYLSYLNLSDNFLSGYIPKELGKLLRLRSLILRANNLNGTVPAELAGHFKNMDFVDLTENEGPGGLGGLEGPCTQLSCTPGD